MLLLRTGLGGSRIEFGVASSSTRRQCLFESSIFLLECKWLNFLKREWDTILIFFQLVSLKPGNFSNLLHWNSGIFPTCFIENLGFFPTCFTENLGFFPTCFTENSGFFRDLVSRLIIRSRLLKVKSRVLFAGISLIYNYREHESNQIPNYRYLFIYKSEKFGIWEWPAM